MGEATIRIEHIEHLVETIARGMHTSPLGPTMKQARELGVMAFETTTSPLVALV